MCAACVAVLLLLKEARTVAPAESAESKSSRQTRAYD
jgi:hypothetical protein